MLLGTGVSNIGVGATDTSEIPSKNISFFTSLKNKTSKALNRFTGLIKGNPISSGIATLGTIFTAYLFWPSERKVDKPQPQPQPQPHDETKKLSDIYQDALNPDVEVFDVGKAEEVISRNLRGDKPKENEGNGFQDVDFQKLEDDFGFQEGSLSTVKLTNFLSAGESDLENQLDEIFQTPADRMDIRKRYFINKLLDICSQDMIKLRRQYEVLYKFRDKVNTQVLVDTLTRRGVANTEEEKVQEVAQKTILKAALLGQLSNLSYTRVGGMKDQNSSVGSALFYGQNVIFELPHVNTNADAVAKHDPKNLIRVLFHDIDAVNTKWVSRHSTHGLCINEQNGTIEEEKLGMTDVKKHFTKFAFQEDKGINIAIGGIGTELRSGVLSSTSGNCGHLLANWGENNGMLAAWLKIESDGPGETSLFGHTHTAAGSSNYVSATGEIKNFGPYMKRDSLHVNCQGLDFETAVEILNAFTAAYDSGNVTEDQIKRILGEQTTPDVLAAMFGTWGINVNNIKGKTVRDIVADARKEFEKNSLKTLKDNLGVDTGLVVFKWEEGLATKSSKYYYYIKDEVVCRAYFGNEFDKVKMFQYRTLELRTNKDSCSIEEDVSKKLFEILSDKTKLTNAFIYGGTLKNKVNLLEDVVREKAILKNTVEADTIAQHALLNGIKFYRAEGAGNISLFGYIITDFDVAEAALQALNISTADRVKIYRNQNKFFNSSETTGASKLKGIVSGTYSLLEATSLIFSNSLKEIRNAHRILEYNSKLIEKVENVKASKVILSEADYNELITQEKRTDIEEKIVRFIQVNAEKGSERSKDDYDQKDYFHELRFTGGDSKLFDSKLNEDDKHIEKIPGFQFFRGTYFPNSYYAYIVTDVNQAIEWCKKPEQNLSDEEIARVLCMQNQWLNSAAKFKGTKPRPMDQILPQKFFEALEKIKNGNRKVGHDTDVMLKVPDLKYNQWCVFRADEERDGFRQWRGILNGNADAVAVILMGTSPVALGKIKNRYLEIINDAGKETPLEAKIHRLYS